MTAVPTVVLRYLSGKACRSQAQEPQDVLRKQVLMSYKTAGEIRSHFWSASVPPAKGPGTGQKVLETTWQTETTTIPPVTAGGDRTEEALEHPKWLPAEQHHG